MRLFTTIFLISLTSVASDEIWVNAGVTDKSFEEMVAEDEVTSMADFQLESFQKKNLEHSYLMAKVDFWSKENSSSTLFAREIIEIENNFVLSSSNRLVLFEYMKTRADSDPKAFPILCRYYANDTYLKTAEPFFESSCQFQRFSFQELDSSFLKFDYALIDGNKIDLRISPYFYSSGTEHQFVFISNRYLTQKFQGTTNQLKQKPVRLETWVSGSCEKPGTLKGDITNPVKAYFSKNCVQEVNQTSSVKSFLSQNKYYIYTGVLLAVVAGFASSRYELGVTLP